MEMQELSLEKFEEASEIVKKVTHSVPVHTKCAALIIRSASSHRKSVPAV